MKEAKIKAQVAGIAFIALWILILGFCGFSFWLAYQGVLWILSST